MMKIEDAIKKDGLNMRKITEEELKVILENHKHWLYRDCKNWESMRADLRYADLRFANLSFSTLRGADFRGANLRCACFSFSSLRGADFRGANLRCADFYGADIRGVKNPPLIPYACPDTGSFIGYKKAHGYIVRLEILSDARRSSATSRKCRCDKAKVLSIQNVDGTQANIKSVSSNYNNDFVYTVGEIVTEPNFCEDRWNECAAGIHFFTNRQWAVNYRG